jgi:hypothetical protein
MMIMLVFALKFDLPKQGRIDQLYEVVKGKRSLKQGI